MPSKAFKLAEAMISNPVMSDIVTNTAAVPVSITNQIEISTDQGVATVNDLPNIGNNAGDIQLVESTNRLYVWNGSGWYNIALINTTPTWDSGGQPAASYELDADSPQDATVITLAASDPEGLPINYTYVTSGQMNSIATISQDSSVFTITPKTAAQVPDGGTGSITFRATDGVNILPQVSSFTLTFSTIVGNSNHTTLLATATGTSDNNNITDSSTNSHSITVAGDTHAGTFSPYRSGGYSTYFDGTLDYLQTPTINLTGNFTVEFFVNLNAITTDVGIFSFGTLNSSNSILELYNYTSGQFRLYSSSGGELGYSSAVEANKWYHVAITRSSNTFKAYLDGVEFASDTTARTINSAISIGGYVSTSYLMNGHIRDFRITTNVEYPSNNFTPPSEPLTAISGTVLLTCHLPYIADGTNNHSITVNGNISTKPFSPYDYDEYSATDHGGSVYFDGSSGDYLAMPVSNDFQFGTGDFTIETWAKVLTTSIDAGRRRIFMQKDAQSASGIFEIIINTDGTIQAYSNADILASTTSFANGSWGHIAFVRDNGTLKVYINGKLENSVSNTTDFSPSSPNPVIGIYPFGGVAKFHGYISDFKITKSAVYTADFTPPTAPPSSSGTLLHIKGTDASIIDKSQGSNLNLVGNTTGSTTQIKFSGSKSMYFDGIDDHIVGPTVSDLNIGTGDFTAECWIYETSLNTNKGIWDGRSTGSTTDGFTFTRINTDAFRIWSGSALITTDPVTIQNTWVHCAVVRYNGTLTIYINGSSSGTPVSNSTNFSNSGTFIIGAGRHGPGATATAFITGYIQDLRVSNYARYTAADETSNIPSAPLEG